MLTQNKCSLGWRGANAYAPNRSSAAEGDDARFLPTSAVAFFNIHLSISDSASLFIFRQDSESLWNMKIDYRGALYGVLRIPLIIGGKIVFFCLLQAGERKFFTASSRNTKHIKK